MSVVIETPRFKLHDLVRYPGYRQAGIAWLEYLIGVGAVYFTVGPLLGGMLPDVKWKLGVVSMALLIRGLLGIVAGPLTGFLVHRFGVRAVVLTGGVTTACLFALTGAVRTPLEFSLVFGVGLAFADTMMANIPAATVVQKWFLTRRAVVMGFVNSGAGWGGLIFAPVMAMLVLHFGWREACVITGVIILVFTTPALFLKRGPQATGHGVDGVDGRVIPDEGHEDVIGTPQKNVRGMLRQPVFWMLCFLFGVESWALGVYAADQVIYLETIGVSAAQSSAALGAAAGIAAGCGMVFSRLSDRISPYYVIILSMASMLIGSIIFLFAHSASLVWVYSVFFGAGYGLFVPAVPTAIARYFGARDIARAMGAVGGAVALFGGLGPFLTGLIADSTGSFQIPIYLITGLLAAAFVVAFFARPRGYALRSVKEVDPNAVTQTVEPAGAVGSADVEVSQPPAQP